MNSELSFKNSLSNYNQKLQGLLIYDGSWKIQSTDKISSDLLLATLKHVVSLNPKNIKEEHLVYWIKNFNSLMSLHCLKNKLIKPIESSDTKVQFSSMNKYGWLSNFFLTLIYDPLHNIFYPSVENGYVAFKARKGAAKDLQVIEFAKIVNPKQVKQQGANLWCRTTPADDMAAITEMERLVSLKFNQNPFIAQWLKKSTLPLEEFTNDNFWGSAMGTTTDPNSNHLGKIIEVVRNSL